MYTVYTNQVKIRKIKKVSDTYPCEYQTVKSVRFSIIYIYLVTVP
jgi:hypothetical protein